MAKYAIWNKEDIILTPIGEVFTAEQWMERYPIARIESITVVCAAGEINGAFFGTLGQMVDMYGKQGCDFSGCETAEDKLHAIEVFEDSIEAMSNEAVRKQTSASERTANALEAIASGQTTENMSAINALLTGEEF